MAPLKPLDLSIFFIIKILAGEHRDFGSPERDDDFSSVPMMQ
jgi:hypothetical protein